MTFCRGSAGRHTLPPLHLSKKKDNTCVLLTCFNNQVSVCNARTHLKRMIVVVACIF